MVIEYEDNIEIIDRKQEKIEMIWTLIDLMAAAKIGPFASGKSKYPYGESFDKLCTKSLNELKGTYKLYKKEING